MRDIERRDAPFLEASDIRFNASFIVGGQIRGEGQRLFRIYAEGNFIEAGMDTPYIPVSYTHLDVYKRQASRRCAGRTLPPLA